MVCGWNEQIAELLVYIDTRTYSVVEWVYITNPILQEAHLVNVSGGEAEEAPNHVVGCLLHFATEQRQTLKRLDNPVTDICCEERAKITYNGTQFLRIRNLFLVLEELAQCSIADRLGAIGQGTPDEDRTVTR